MAEITGEVEISASTNEPVEEEKIPRGFKRQFAIEKTGVDPKTVNKFYPNSGVRHTPITLTEKTRTRGGKNSRRRTARVWE